MGEDVELGIIFGDTEAGWAERERLFGETLYPVARPELCEMINSVEDLLGYRLIEIAEPPVLRDNLDVYADPLPQALVLTAIVISFGMTAVVVMIALGSYLGSNDDHVDDLADDQAPEDSK